MILKFRVAAIRTPHDETQVELEPVNEDGDLSRMPQVHGVLLVYFPKDRAPGIAVGQEVTFEQVAG